MKLLPMKIRNIFELVLLAMLWGASFLFIRVSVSEFGAIPMMAVRVAIAGLILIPILYWKKGGTLMFNNIKSISVVGVLGSAIPFCLIAYSTLYVTAGFASVVNAATPMFAASVAFVWLGQKLSKVAVLGLFISLSGVTLLVWDKIGFDESKIFLAVLAGLTAAFGYGLAVNYNRINLAGVSPLAITTGSLIAAAIVLLPLAIYFWPSQNPSLKSWLNVILLAVVCTAFAQLLFFRLLDTIGGTSATTVTFLIPVFGLLWGSLLLDELIEMNTLIAGVIILLGTAMTIGLIKFRFNKYSNMN